MNLILLGVIPIVVWLALRGEVDSGSKQAPASQDQCVRRVCAVGRVMSASVLVTAGAVIAIIAWAGS